MTDDTPRQAATGPDIEFSLTIDDAATMYERAGLPRTLRSIQRYCAKGDLDAHRIETAYGEKFLITPASVKKHIAYIEEVRQATAGRGEPRPVATGRNDEPSVAGERRQATSSRGEPRQDAATGELMSHYIARLEGENEFLRGQIAVKDEQIKEQTERARETNILIGGLQKMLTPLLGHGGTSPSDHRQPADMENGG